MLTRDGKLAAIESRIRHSTQIGKKLEESLAELEAEAARMERSGKQVTPELQKQIDDVRDKIRENSEDIARREEDKVQLSDQFAADLKRYRELKGIAAN